MAPPFIEPCLPTISRTVPTGPQWAFEIKHDGFRFIWARASARARTRVPSRSFNGVFSCRT
jgi:ATP-dependent DNA ligase